MKNSIHLKVLILWSPNHILKEMCDWKQHQMSWPNIQFQLRGVGNKEEDKPLPGGLVIVQGPSELSEDEEFANMGI